MRPRILYFCCVVAGVCILTGPSPTLAQTRGERREITPAKHIDRQATDGPGEVVYVDGVEMGTLYPIPRDATIEHYVAGTGPVGEFKLAGDESDVDACRYDPMSVYCNTLSNRLWQPPGGNPAIIVADDIAITAVSGCELDRYVFAVDGNADGLGVGGFGVDAALYPGCPMAGGTDPIPGTECQVDFEDNGLKVVTCPVPPGIQLPQNLYLAIRFSKLHCAIVVGAPALKGFSADSLDFPSFACVANLGGYLPSSQYDTYRTHASFYAQVYTREPCPSAFPAYKNSNHAGLSYTPGGGRRFADDIHLSVPECNMVAYEVAIKGNGVTSVDLRTTLSDSDPVNGGVIPETWNFIIGGPGVVIGHFDFDPPIPLPTSDLWVGFLTTGASTGPIITGKQAALGATNDSLAVYDGHRWIRRPLTDGRYAATDVTIFCEGSPPIGACCDMIQTTNRICIGGLGHGNPCTRNVDCGVCVGEPHEGDPCDSDSDCDGGECTWGGTCIGESVCRDDLPEMNCAFPRWAEGEACGADPFSPACGLSACCTLDSGCLDLTQQECFAQPPSDNPRVRHYQLGKYCGVDKQVCPWVACYAREGACERPHGERGCDYSLCCTAVCDSDPFCCYVSWDELCVEIGLTSTNKCSDRLSNECAGSGLQGARLVEPRSSVFADTRDTSANPGDPGFCCFVDDPGAQAPATKWYKFVAPEPSIPGNELSTVGLSTCNSDAENALDSLIQVFAISDPDRGVCEDGTRCKVSHNDCADGSTCLLDDIAACKNLLPIACSDDTGCTGSDRPNNASLCVSNLVPGETYYVMVGVKTVEDGGVYRLDITSPCITDDPILNDLCMHAEQLRSYGEETIVVPFDLSGGPDYAPATFDCPGAYVAPELVNDIWYEWTAQCDGAVTIETCNREQSDPEAQPDTTLVVYEGCDCPVPDQMIVGNSSNCEPDCGPSSCVTIDAIGGECYKIRLGGSEGGTPAGDLTIITDCPACATGEVVFLDPHDGTVDARQPHPPDDPPTLQGIDSFLVEAPSGSNMLQCWSLCETADTGAPNSIASIADNGDGKITIQLDRPITPLAVTTLTYTGEEGAAYTGTFTSHPANVSGDDEANGEDTSAWIHAMHGSAEAPWGIYSTDCNHSGSVDHADLLCVVNLLNGGDGFAPGYRGTELPTNPGICP